MGSMKILDCTKRMTWPGERSRDSMKISDRMRKLKWLIEGLKNLMMMMILALMNLQPKKGRVDLLTSRGSKRTK